MELSEKEENVREIISNLKSAVIAFSGGVDSTLLLRLAAETLGEKVIAVTVDSPIQSSNLLCEVRRLAAQLCVKHEIIQGRELEDPDFCQNTFKRCYICKTKAYQKLKIIAQKYGMKALCDGTNADDVYDFRPGLLAASEAQVVSPLKKAGLTKKEVRLMAKKLNLPNWDKPASPCLCTRIPYGEEITIEKLRKIDKAERFLQDLGFKKIRVRYHGKLARIEVDELEMLLMKRKIINNYLKELGFTYITLDINGFKSGKTNNT